MFSYNDRNEMTVAAYSSTPGGTVSQMVTYVYDAYGNRIEQDYWNGTTTVVTRFGMDGWDPAQPTPVGNENFNTWADLNSSNALTTRREFGTGFDQPIAQQSSSGTVLWYLTDYEGSVRQIVNNSGTVVGTLAYTAFGQITTNSGTTDRYGYTGMQWDTAVNLYVDGAREYNPATGRYQQQDPKGFGAGDPDLYRYVKNAPTDATDSSGDEIIFNYPKKQGILSISNHPFLGKKYNVMDVQYIGETAWGGNIILKINGKQYTINKDIFESLIKNNIDKLENLAALEKLIQQELKINPDSVNAPVPQ